MRSIELQFNSFVITVLTFDRIVGVIGIRLLVLISSTCFDLIVSLLFLLHLHQLVVHATISLPDNLFDLFLLNKFFLQFFVLRTCVFLIISHLPFLLKISNN